jgi:hypothetical protein
MADKKFSELTAIAGGDVAGDDVVAILDISDTEVKKLTKNGLVIALAAPAVRDLTRNLISKYVTAATADIDADEIIVTDSTGVALKLSSINLTVDIGASGANGLDTGSEAASTWYYMWAIYNATTTTIAGLLSVSSSDPTLPSGYTYKARIGAVYNDSGSDFAYFFQRDNVVSIDAIEVLSGGTAGIITSIDISVAVPPIAATIGGVLDVERSAVTAGGVVYSASGASYNKYTCLIDVTGSGATKARSISPFSKLVITVPQTTYYISLDSSSIRIELSEYTI